MKKDVLIKNFIDEIKGSFWSGELSYITVTDINGRPPNINQLVGCLERALEKGKNISEDNNPGNINPDLGNKIYNR